MARSEVTCSIYFVILTPTLSLSPGLSTSPLYLADTLLGLPPIFTSSLSSQIHTDICLESFNMLSSLTYRRPAYVSSPRGSVIGDSKPKSLNESIGSGSTYCAFGIPDALAFDRIICGGTCPVSSTDCSCQLFNPEGLPVLRQAPQHTFVSYSSIVFERSIRISICPVSPCS